MAGGGRSQYQFVRPGQATQHDVFKSAPSRGRRQLHLEYSSHLLSGDPLVRSLAEDSEHANLDVGFAIDAFKVGILFSASDMKHFAATLDRVMWNRSSSSPELSGASMARWNTDTINLADWTGLVGLGITTESPGWPLH